MLNSQIEFDNIYQNLCNPLAMANNYTARKAMQVSEEMAPAVHIPIMVGNEIFVLTQQDIRRVEDTRLISYSRLGPNGQFIPLDTSSPGAVYVPPPNPTHFCTLDDLLRNVSDKRVRMQMDIDEDVKHPAKSNNDTCLFLRETSNPLKTVASVSTQLEWSKKKSDSKHRLRLCYDAGTSTSGLMTNTGCQHCPKCETQHSSCQTQMCAKTHTILEREIPRNASCQTKDTGTATRTSIVKEPQDVGCQTQSCLSANTHIKNEPVNLRCQAQRNTNSTGCGTYSDLFETASAESYTSAECYYTSSAESTSPCPCQHCKSQQTCTEQTLIVPMEPQVQSPVRPQEHPCTSKHIRFDPCTQVNNCPNFEEPHFYRTIPLGQNLYPRAQVSKSIRKPTYGLDESQL
ncbi:uncharacterized protein LOC117142917 [Drosophila mauritiana]|uniref:Uncharacterized protein LOC117142917 n=1 Tax=Drosophila mauritiana TaxID=7226 RepID=A0A6P8KI98_DROMA|nr:uncharacterized protein LOC117142917 [Drosophila mauritiana]